MNEEYEGPFLLKLPSYAKGVDLDEAALDAFGKLLMEYVRDAAIHDVDGFVSGLSDSVTGRKFANIPQIFSPEQREILHDLIPVIVDETIHHLLWTLDQVTWVDVVVRTEAGETPSLRNSAEALAWEAFSWVPKHSKKRYEKTP